MPPTLRDIDFSDYPPLERIAFAHQLMGDAMAELRGETPLFTSEQIASFQADIDAYDAGKLQARDWEEVRAELKKELP